MIFFIRVWYYNLEYTYTHSRYCGPPPFSTSVKQKETKNIKKPKKNALYFSAFRPWSAQEKKSMISNTYTEIFNLKTDPKNWCCIFATVRKDLLSH